VLVAEFEKCIIDCVYCCTSALLVAVLLKTRYISVISVVCVQHLASHCLVPQPVCWITCVEKTSRVPMLFLVALLVDFAQAQEASSSDRNSDFKNSYNQPF